MKKLMCTWEVKFFCLHSVLFSLLIVWGQYFLQAALARRLRRYAATSTMYFVGQCGQIFQANDERSLWPASTTSGSWLAFAPKSKCLSAAEEHDTVKKVFHTTPRGPPLNYQSAVLKCCRSHNVSSFCCRCFSFKNFQEAYKYLYHGKKPYRFQLHFFGVGNIPLKKMESRIRWKWSLTTFLKVCTKMSKIDSKSL